MCILYFLPYDARITTRLFKLVICQWCWASGMCIWRKATSYTVSHQYYTLLFQIGIRELIPRDLLECLALNDTNGIKKNYAYLFSIKIYCICGFNWNLLDKYLRYYIFLFNLYMTFLIIFVGFRLNYIVTTTTKKLKDYCTRKENLFSFSTRL